MKENIVNRFNHLSDKIAMVASWPGYTLSRVNAVVQIAWANGTIAKYEGERENNPFIDLVFSVSRENPYETLCYVRQRLMEVWGRNYHEWTDLFCLPGLRHDQVSLIPGSRVFQPNSITVAAVDFASNWLGYPKRTSMDRVIQEQADVLAGFETLFNVCQSPQWVLQMDGHTVPFVIATALKMQTELPDFGTWTGAPEISCSEGKVSLGGARHIRHYCYRAMPVVRAYTTIGCPV